jgi:hypothetical protein
LCCLAAPRSAFAQWLETFGEGWVDARLGWHDTTQEYGPDGDRQDFFGSGRAITRSLYVTAATGLWRGADAWVQVPIHYLTFDDAAAERNETGFGDIRVFLRVDPSLVGLSTFPVAVRGGIKIPAKEFPVDAEVIPLTEGQVDLELFLEAGHSFYPTPLYAMGWFGYRWRLAKGNIRDPGDEVLAYAAAGGDLGTRFVWKIAGEGLWGGTPLIDRVPVENARRRIIQLLPSVGFKLGPGAIDVGGRIPLSGRNLPAGPALIVGYFFRWNASGD